MSVYGYHSGPSRKMRFPVANTADIKEGDMLKIDGAGQYATPAGAGDAIIGVALNAQEKPTTDGDKYVWAETHPEAIFEYPTDDATAIGASVLWKTCDTKTAQSIDIGASAVDNIYIWGYDAKTATLLVSIDFKSPFTGVV